MTLANPKVDYVAELLNLRHVYISAPPQARLNVICERMRAAETGPARLVTVVSAVEGLARSLALHASAKTSVDVGRLYRKYKDRAPHSLVEEVFRLHRKPEPSVYFADDTWLLFKHAVNFRNLIVHECTYLGQDKYPSLIGATEEVFGELISLGKLRDKRT